MRALMKSYASVKILPLPLASPYSLNPYGLFVSRLPNSSNQTINTLI